jgi:hypothetical protein
VRAKGIVDGCHICLPEKKNLSVEENFIRDHHKIQVLKCSRAIRVLRDYLPKGFFFLPLKNIIWGIGSARIVFDFKAKEQIPVSFDQLGSSYYTHKDIPFLIVVVEFWLEDSIVKRVFVVVSNHNKQDVNYVLDSLNFILSLDIFSEINTIYLVSDNATNLKNGYDFFNLFSPNGVLSGSDKKKKFTFIRLFSWFALFVIFYII